MARLELKINDELARDLEAFAKESGTSKSEIFRRALTLYAVAREEKKSGRQMGFGKDGRIEREIIAL
jgi:metal-responsive CopG/Arc/MetJ family transcriptional regulator